MECKDETNVDRNAQQQLDGSCVASIDDPHEIAEY